MRKATRRGRPRPWSTFGVKCIALAILMAPTCCPVPLIPLLFEDPHAAIVAGSTGIAACPTIIDSAGCAQACLGLLRMRGGAGRRPASTPAKDKGEHALGRQPKRLPVEGQTDILDSGGSAKQTETLAGAVFKKSGHVTGVRLPAAVRAAAAAAAAKKKAAEAEAAEVQKNAPHKRPASEVVTGAYFRKAVRAAEAAASASQNSKKRLQPDEYRPGAADSPDQETPFDTEKPPQQQLPHPINRSAFVPVIYDGVLGREPVRERDEWCVFRNLLLWGRVAERTSRRVRQQKLQCLTHSCFVCTCAFLCV